MTKLLIVLFIGLIFEAVGVVYLNKGLKTLPPLEQKTPAAVWKMIKAGAGNAAIGFGILFEAIFFGCLLFLMSRGDVSFVWPLTSLGFVLTSLAARFILNEEVSTLRWTGVMLIVLGAGIITYSEKLKEAAKASVAQPVSGTATRPQ
jgi:uncharacterized membrane protein